MTTSANKTPAKSTSAKSAPVNTPENDKVETPEVSTNTESPETTPVKETSKAGIIPETLQENPILVEFCKQYLEVVKEIAAYNEKVLAEKDSEWTPVKILEKSRELASPSDANVKPHEEIKKVVDEFEKAATALSLARRAVMEATAKELGISLSATAERDPAIEGPLKERRKFGHAIGQNLKQIAGFTTDKAATDAVNKFLEDNELPAVGRDQSYSFGGDTVSTPKYRVLVSVKNNDGEELVKADGFTKAAQALTKHYKRGEAPKSDTLRDIWEKAGNSATNVVSPVEFTDNELHFVITKK